jgi:phosphate transport system protein
MGERAIEAVHLAARALVEEDVELCNEVLALDDAIDELELIIDNESIRYISLRSPVATELRLLTTGMKFGGDLERVGDEACTIAKRAKKLMNQPPIGNLFHISEMARLGLDMLRDSIRCFLEEDVETARQIPMRDKEVDRLNKANFAEITVAITQNPEQAGKLLDLIFISKSIERIADHATNLAEEVVYLYSGKDVRHTEETKRSTFRTVESDD